MAKKGFKVNKGIENMFQRGVGVREGKYIGSEWRVCPRGCERGLYSG